MYYVVLQLLYGAKSSRSMREFRFDPSLKEKDACSQSDCGSIVPRFPGSITIVEIYSRNQGINMTYVIRRL